MYFWLLLLLQLFMLLLLKLLLLKLLLFELLLLFKLLLLPPLPEIFLPLGLQNGILVLLKLLD